MHAHTSTVPLLAQKKVIVLCLISPHALEIIKYIHKPLVAHIIDVYTHNIAQTLPIYEICSL